MIPSKDIHLLVRQIDTWSIRHPIRQIRFDRQRKIDQQLKCKSYGSNPKQIRRMQFGHMQRHHTTKPIPVKFVRLPTNPDGGLAIQTQQQYNTLPLATGIKRHRPCKIRANR